jgi:hypothetical protein
MIAKIDCDEDRMSDGSVCLRHTHERASYFVQDDASEQSACLQQCSQMISLIAMMFTNDEA